MTDDELRNANLGETVTVRREVEFSPTWIEPGVFYGSDRIGRSEVTDVEIAKDEYGDDLLVVTFEGEITKALGRFWDSSSQPRTAAEQRATRRRSWMRRALHAASIIVPVGAAVLVSAWVMGKMAGRPIQTEPIQPPGIETFVFLFLGGVFILWSIQYLPGMAGGRSYR